MALHQGLIVASSTVTVYVNEFHRSVIKMRLCLLNEAFLPQEGEKLTHES